MQQQRKLVRWARIKVVTHDLLTHHHTTRSPPSTIQTAGGSSKSSRWVYHVFVLHAALGLGRGSVIPGSLDRVAIEPGKASPMLPFL